MVSCMKCSHGSVLGIGTLLYHTYSILYIYWQIGGFEQSGQQYNYEYYNNVKIIQ